MKQPCKLLARNVSNCLWKLVENIDLLFLWTEQTCAPCTTGAWLSATGASLLLRRAERSVTISITVKAILMLIQQHTVVYARLV
jgi:hypothetical protein